MKNLKKFLTVTGYTEYAMSQNFIAPNVSFVKESDNVIYNRTKPQKHEAQINATYKEHYSNYNVVINASVIGDGIHTPTGTATLSINGTTQTKSVNALSFDVLIEEDGTYSFTLTYNGDDFYETASTQGSFDVHDYSKDYFTLSVISAGTIYTSTGDFVELYYSNDNGLNWNPSYDETFNVSAGDKILFKSSSSYRPLYVLDTSSAIFEAEGNIMSLLYDGDNFSASTTLRTVSAFNGMFQDCTGLTSAGNLILPATALTRSCYDSMFYGCTKLTTAPELPATTLADSCYYQMFKNCTSLVTAPELPATTLAYDCYYEMFYDCHSLNYIKCLATDITSADGCTSEWVGGSGGGSGSGSGSGGGGVSPTGTFVKAASMENWTTGSDGIPEGWKIENV